MTRENCSSWAVAAHLGKRGGGLRIDPGGYDLQVQRTPITSLVDPLAGLFTSLSGLYIYLTVYSSSLQLGPRHRHRRVDYDIVTLALGIASSARGISHQTSPHYIIRKPPHRRYSIHLCVCVPARRCPYYSQQAHFGHWRLLSLPIPLTRCAACNFTDELLCASDIHKCT